MPEQWSHHQHIYQADPWLYHCEGFETAAVPIIHTHEIVRLLHYEKALQGSNTATDYSVWEGQHYMPERTAKASQVLCVRL